MARYRISLYWIGALSLALGFVQGTLSQVDFGALHARVGEAFADTLSYRSMSDAQVAEVFDDRLTQVESGKNLELARHLIRLCRHHHFDPAFILALIQTESDFNARAVSPRGAMGLMQLMPATAHWLAARIGYRPLRRNELLDPFMNLSLGVAYLSELRARYPKLGGYYMLAAYNMGPAKLGEFMEGPPNATPLSVMRYVRTIRESVEGFRAYKRENRA